MHEALGEEEYVAPYGVHMYTVHQETAAQSRIYQITGFESPIFQSTPLETYSSYLLFSFLQTATSYNQCLLIP
jgi:hypothetical protein